MDAEQHERYVRWQDYRIKQLTFIINLFIGFAIASLAFAINVKLDGKPHSGIPIEPTIIWWALSASFGSFATIVRFFDFRYTAKKIKDGGWFNSSMAKLLGPVTLLLTCSQIAAYGIGAWLFVLGVIGAKP